MVDAEIIARALELLARGLETNNERLAAVEQQLATLVAALSPREGEPNPLHDLLERIVHMQEQMDSKLDTLLAGHSKPNGSAAPP